MTRPRRGLVILQQIMSCSLISFRCRIIPMFHQIFILLSEMVIDSCDLSWIN